MSAATEEYSVSSDDRSAPLSDAPGAGRSRKGPACDWATLAAFGNRCGIASSEAALIQDAGVALTAALCSDLFGIAEVTDGGATVKLTVAAGNEPGCVVSHEGPIDATHSAAACALASDSPVLSPDLALEQRYSDPFLPELGVAAALTVPLVAGGKPFGALGVYQRSPREFSPGEIEFLEAVSRLLGPALSRLKLERELAEQQAFTAAVLGLIDALVLTLDSRGNVLEMNAACQRVTGCSLEEARGRSLWSVLIAPEHVDLARRMVIDCGSGKKAACGFEASVTCRETGRPRHVAWSLKALEGSGRARTLILAGLDRTELTEAETELEILREFGPQAGDALPEIQAAAGSPSPPVARKPRQELRAAPRRAFEYRQRIAPMFGRSMPSQKKFFEVQCKDISSSGIAFYMDRSPDFHIVVIELGGPPRERYFTAQVARVTKVERDGQKQFLVGCRFTGKM